jgi:hypothetical protein
VSCDGSDGVNLNQNGVIENAKTYKISFEVLNYVGGFLNGRIGSANSNDFTVNSNGSYSFNVLSDGTNLIFRSSSFDGSVTNISVIEITDDTDLPRINYEGFSYQDSLGSEEVVNGDFSNGSANWSLSSECEVVNSQARIYSSDGSFQYIQQVNVFDTSKQYKLEFDVISSNGAVLGFAGGIPDVSTNVLGKKTLYVSPSISTLQIKRSSGITDVTIDNVSVKEYFGQEAVPDSGCGSLLLEPQSTNLFTYSEDFENSDWMSGGGGAFTITSNAVISPDGTLNASKLIASGVGFQLRQNKAIINTQMSNSFYMRTNQGTRQMSIRINDNEITETFVVTSEWKRYTVSGLVGGTLNGSGRCSLNNVDILDENNHVYIYGAQLESGSYPTSYIPTNGSTATRLADVCNNAGSSDLINSTEGVLYAEISANENLSGRWISLSNGTTSERVSIAFQSDDIRLYIRNASGLIWDYTYTNANTFDYNKIGLKYKSENYALWINGIEVATNSSSNILSGLNSLQFDNSSGLHNFYGNVKSVVVYKEALTNDELEGLTGEGYDTFNALALANNYTII